VKRKLQGGSKEVKYKQLNKVATSRREMKIVLNYHVGQNHRGPGEKGERNGAIIRKEERGGRKRL